MIDVSGRIWSKEDKEAWEKLLDKMEKLEETLIKCPFCGAYPFLDDDQEETGNVGGIPFRRNYFELTCRKCGIWKQAPHTEAGLQSLVDWWNKRDI